MVKFKCKVKTPYIQWQSRSRVGAARLCIHGPPCYSDGGNERTATAMNDGVSGICRRLVQQAFVAFFVLCGWSSAGFAGPSFDCSKAKSHAEKAICASDELEELDVELSTAYRSALADGRTTASLQRKWLKRRDADCEIPRMTSCLNIEMTQRIESLKNEIEVEDINSIVRIVSMQNSGQVRKAVDGLNQGARLNGIPGSIKSYKRLVEFVAGQEDQVWAGLCDLETDGTRQAMVICADHMVGHFYKEPSPNGQISYGELARFGVDNCVGG